MSKTIKVIDLLNKIANGEEVPDKVKRISGVEYEYHKNSMNYYDNETYQNELFNDDIGLNVNDEVEIIEEEPEIDIQGMLGLLHLRDFECDKTDIRLNREKINELVKAVKQLDNQINNK